MMQPKLAISSIAWDITDEPSIYTLINSQNFHFLELIPDRIFKKGPLKVLLEIKDYGFSAIAFQSLLYGTDDLYLFKTSQQRNKLFDQLQKCCELAELFKVRALVFGSPKNRYIEGDNKKQAGDLASDFFQKIGDVALKCKTAICIEPVPECYSCNFLTNTAETADFVKKLDHPGIKLNLDLGTISQNGEDLLKIWNSIYMQIGHIHWSNPSLVQINKLKSGIPENLFTLLRQENPGWNYDGIVSIEMLSTKENRHNDIKNALQYAKSVIS